MTTKSARDEHQDEAAEENRCLRPQQFEMNQIAPSDWGREQERDLRLGERQSGSLSRNDPPEQQEREQGKRAERFDERRVFGGDNHAPGLAKAEHGPKKE